jgi:carbon monoxide dehydrogenase subunit G
MELSNEFVVGVPVAVAWDVLTDVERIAPCLPGAQCQEIEGDEFRGIVKVKVGPITAQYKGKAVFVELDEEKRTMTLTASGRDTRGQGNANATITAELWEVDEGTHVSVLTDLMLTGKVAQFGRGVLADVSAKLMREFVENLETTVLSDYDNSRDDEVEETEEDSVVGQSGDVDGGATGDAAEPAIRIVDHPEPEAVDLVGHASTPVLKRLVPVVLGLAVVFVVLRMARRRRRAG